MSNDEKISLEERLAGLAEFLPIFEADGFRFGALRCDPGTLPWYELSRDASRFLKEAYRLGWVLGDFDWPSWARGPEARRLVDDPTALAQADADTLARLLTAHIRQERFCEGHLAAMFECGHLTAILRRAAQLLSTIREGEQ